MCEIVVKAFLFDMDGVLVDSLDTHFYAFNATFQKFGAEKIRRETFLEKFWGTYIEKDVELVFGKISRQLVKEIVEEYPLEIEKFTEYTKIYPEAKRVLMELKKKDVKVGLVSSSQKRIVDTLIQHVGLQDYFDVTICGDQVIRPKPAPDGINKACSFLGVKPSEAVYIGDGIQDVVAGKSAGCFTIAVTTTCGKESLKGADLIIDSLAKLHNFKR